MRYFLDTEFIEYPNTIDLISIGIKAEDGRTLYAISSEYNFDKASEWVVDNVITPMFNETVSVDNRPFTQMSSFHKEYGVSVRSIKQQIIDFVGFPEYSKGMPEFWAYYGAYDWVVFCWIFGAMIDLPDGFPMHCNDLKQLMDSTKGTKLPSPEGEHNALVDAEWNERLYNHLTKLKPKKNE